MAIPLQLRLPLLLNDYETQLKKGDNLVFAAFGGGFTLGIHLFTNGHTIQIIFTTKLITKTMDIKRNSKL